MRGKAEAFFAEMPPIDQDSEFFHSAFEMLKSERHSSMDGVSPIPFSKIVKFAQYYELNQHECDRLVYLVMTLDRIERNLIAEQTARQRAKKQR